MLHAEWIEHLKRENKSKYFDQIKNYYIHRKLKRCIEIDRKILNHMEDHSFLIVHTEEEFNEKCQKQLEKKIIHFLIPNHRNHLLWQKSNGPISTLNEFIIRKEEDEESIDEEEIFLKNNEKCLIIAAKPGMGKSLILDNFTQNSSAENFFIKITLNTCAKSLNNLKNQKIERRKKFDVLEFVLKSLLNKTNEQEISLLKHLAR